MTHIPCIHCMQGVFFMCRQQELWGWMLVAFGAGILFAFILESGFLRCCIGAGAVALGILVMQRK